MIRCILLLSLFAAPLTAQEKEEGFTPLFNGKDLSGWVNVNCAPETWTVKEGMIHCDGVPTGAMLERIRKAVTAAQLSPAAELMAAAT